jgi:hypothetical protein
MDRKGDTMSRDALVGTIIGCALVVAAAAWAQWYLRRP